MLQYKYKMNIEKINKEVSKMSKIKTKMVVDYLINMITMDVVTDEETKDVINTIWYILEVNDMTEEYLPELHRLKA